MSCHRCARSIAPLQPSTAKGRCTHGSGLLSAEYQPSLQLDQRRHLRQPAHHSAGQADLVLREAEHSWENSPFPGGLSSPWRDEAVTVTRYLDPIPLYPSLLLSIYFQAKCSQILEAAFSFLKLIKFSSPLPLLLYLFPWLDLFIHPPQEIQGYCLLLMFSYC